tara:strand:+ start:152 stop:421 length:270 start_codon:yes stop_codon:yes gene_type:complete
MATDNKFNWKKALQVGALGTDALSKGSAGGLGKAIVESKIDLSGSFDAQDTEKAAGGDLTEFQKKKMKKKILNPSVSDPFGKNKTNYYA